MIAVLIIFGVVGLARFVVQPIAERQGIDNPEKWVSFVYVTAFGIMTGVAMAAGAFQ